LFFFLTSPNFHVKVGEALNYSIGDTNRNLTELAEVVIWASNYADKIEPLR
jgi:hypothetical protein